LPADVTVNAARICLWVENYSGCFALGPFERAARWENSSWSLSL